jgi:hypothetical protein
MEWASILDMRSFKRRPRFRDGRHLRSARFYNFGFDWTIGETAESSGLRVRSKSSSFEWITIDTS